MRKSISPSQEREIIRQHSAGVTFRGIAERLGVSKGAVQRVIDRAMVPRRPVQRRAGTTTGKRAKNILR